MTESAFLPATFSFRFGSLRPPSLHSEVPKQGSEFFGFISSFLPLIFIIFSTLRPLLYTNYRLGVVSLYIGTEGDEKVLGSEHPNLSDYFNNLAGLYFEQGKYTEAEPFYQKSIAIWEKSLLSDHPKLALVYENYGLLLQKMSREKEAQGYLAKAHTIRQQRKLEAN